MHKGLDILAQFLVESTTLALIGGLVGVGVRIVGAKMVRSLCGWRTVISPIYGFLSFVVSALVGAFFGAILRGKHRNFIR